MARDNERRLERLEARLNPEPAVEIVVRWPHEVGPSDPPPDIQLLWPEELCDESQRQNEEHEQEA